LLNTSKGYQVIPNRAHGKHMVYKPMTSQYMVKHFHHFSQKKKHFHHHLEYEEIELCGYDRIKANLSMLLKL
jgi:hypothetical protein